MKTAQCENCEIRNPGLMQGRCLNCHYPIERSKEEKRKYRNQLSDLKYYLRKLDQMPGRLIHLGGLVFFVMFGISIFTLIASNENLYVLIILAALALYFALIGWLMNPFNKLQLLIFGGAYLLATIAELIFFGLPTRLMPGIGVEEGWVGWVPFFNSLSPYIYFIFRICLIIPFGMAFLRHLQIDRAPSPMLDFALEQIV